MQRIGDMCRLINDNVFLEHMKESINHARRTCGGLFVVTDVRFEQEAEMIRQLGGTIVHIFGRTHAATTDKHISEQRLKVCEYTDICISNSGTLQELHTNTLDTFSSMI